MKRNHNFLKLTYSGFALMVMGNSSRTYSRKFIPFEEIYHVSYDSELTKERNNALLEIVRNKSICASSEENLSAKEIFEKYKKLADKRYNKSATKP